MSVSIANKKIVIIGLGLIIGHWMFTGEVMKFPPPTPTTSQAATYVWQCMVGSVVLGVIVAVPGTIAAYTVARLVKRK